MNTRKDFLLTTSLFALAPSIADAASPAPSASFTFDRARFDAILAKPAKHKQCFGAVAIDGGDVMSGMANTMNAYERYLGEAPGSVQTVAVLYHGAAIALAMTSGVWNDLLLPSLKNAPAKVRAEFSDAKPGKGNPYLSDVAQMVKRGSSFFVCHNAIEGFSEIAAGALEMPKEKAHAAIMAGIVPGALVVPAGVMAINACQEAKFTYVQSSL
ncbi:MAG TPA: hypothetical protein VJP85_03570 [Candidatus Baltobacteraceae bacterium]|nr:hypothetical protein [Candidatus Baltobacteraceae bacterium]